MRHCAIREPSYWRSDRNSYHSYVPYSRYFLLGCNFHFFSRLSGIREKLTYRKFMTLVHVCQTILSVKHVIAIIAVPQRQLPNSKDPLSWLNLLPPVPSLTRASPLPLVILVCMPLTSVSITIILTKISVASISGTNYSYLSLCLVNVNR